MNLSGLLNYAYPMNLGLGSNEPFSSNAYIDNFPERREAVEEERLLRMLQNDQSRNTKTK